MGSVVDQIIHEKKLQGSKCARCSYVCFPAISVCPKCGPAFVEHVRLAELPSKGTVITWTQLRVAPKGFPSPLLHCVLDLGIVKILGTVQRTDEVRIGEKMVIVEDASGRFPYVFCPSTS